MGRPVGLDRWIQATKPRATVGKTVALEHVVMTTMKFLTPIALVATFALAAAPAQAGQHRGGGDRGGERSHGSAPRGSVSRGPSGPRGVARPRVYSPGYRGSVRVGPRIVGPRRYIVGGSRFYRPYYSFRPRLSLGLGFWAGYPVPYPYYGYPYPYPVDPYAYGYAAPSYGYPAQSYPADQYPDDPSDPDYGPSGQGYPPQQQSAPSVGVQQGNQATPGGVSFEITPDSAAVFVDGTYVGTAADFSPTSQPLGLVTGRHHIEIRANGYRTMTLDSDVTSGQVIPYKGTLQPN
jgi:hypothetical protein